jgi:hypothetical protein
VGGYFFFSIFTPPTVWIKLGGFLIEVFRYFPLAQLRGFRFAFVRFEAG